MTVHYHKLPNISEIGSLFMLIVELPFMNEDVYTVICHLV